eukprot:5952190-Prymnesium_polylepis.2
MSYASSTLTHGRRCVATASMTRFFVVTTKRIELVSRPVGSSNPVFDRGVRPVSRSYGPVRWQ